MVTSRAPLSKYDSLPVADVANGGSAARLVSREREDARHARCRCAFYCVLLLLPAAVLLYLIARTGSAGGAWQPEPRRDMPDWRRTHQAYVREIKQRAEDLKLVFYGDSITEAWRGTSRGKEVSRAVGIPAVWEQYFGQTYGAAAAAYGISGDFTKHLMWRLQHGETLPELSPDLVVVLIGTNDLADCEFHTLGCRAAEEAPNVAAHIMGILAHINAAMPGAHVLLNAVMPRASRYKELDSEPDSFYDQPSLFSEAIHIINVALRDSAEALPWVTYLDCASEFLSKDKKVIDKALMPDGLHPSGAGAAKWAECMMPVIKTHAPVAAEG